jgi:membrane protein DedA with SNARE-associated domain
MRRKNIIKFSLVAGFIILWSIIITILGTEKIVDFLGAQNSYIIIFIVGAVGGVSTITSTSFYTTLTTLAHGGVNPWFLGLFGGIGITIGDSLFYYLGKKGEESLPEKARKATGKFSDWMKRHPKWLIPIVTFVYSGCTPLPNDILTVSLGIAKYRYIVGPLLLGNIFLTTIIALIASGVF